MLFNVYFHQMDHSLAFEKFISDKLNHVMKHLPKLRNVKVIVDKNAGAINKFGIKMIAKLGAKEVCLHGNNKNIYLAANEVIRKLKEFNQ